MMTSGKDPKFPLPDKLSKIAKFELFAGNATVRSSFLFGP